MFIIFILLIIVLIIIFLLIKSHSLTWKIIGIIVLFITILVAILVNYNIISIPIGIRHFANLLISPRNLYKPIVFDQFEFYKKGYTKRYELAPEYFDIYEVGITACDSGISSKYKFKGKIKAVFESDGKHLFEKYITSPKSAVFLDAGMALYKKIALEYFEIPLLGKYEKDISLTLTVIEPDLELEKYKDCIKLHVSVSGIP